MPEVNATRSNRLTSTETMEDASELAHVVKEGEGRALDWHADHDNRIDAYNHSRTADLGRLVHGVSGAFGLGTAGAATTLIVKSAASNAPELLTNPGATIVDKLVTPAQAFGGRVVAALTTTAGGALAGIAALAAPTIAVVANGMSSGDEVHRLGDLDAIDAATTMLLDLDAGFKQADIAKHPGTLPVKLVEFMMTSDFGREHMPALQADADEGMRAALAALRCGGPDAYFKIHPEARDRVRDDVAFNKGFESVMWCAAAPDGDARLDAIRKGLETRDPRFNAPHVVHG